MTFQKNSKQVALHRAGRMIRAWTYKGSLELEMILKLE